MKHSLRLFLTIFSPKIFIWVFPILLIVPNIVLDVTEYSSPLAKITNILLPLGLYLFIMGIWKNVGRTSLFFIPVLVYTCVQLVLLHLYGESIIAVDMLLNLVTTNVNEASELLGNLVLAIIIVGIVYIPLLIWGLVLAVGQVNCPKRYLKYVRTSGEFIMGVGLITLCLSYALVKPFRITRDIFPFNVFTNTVIAIQRTISTHDYYRTSADFDYHSSSSRNIDEKEIYVLIIGETSRADNWQIFGYHRPTNPRLSLRTDLLTFPKTLTESNTTHKSVPLMLTWMNAENFGDSIFYSKSIIDAFNNAGYRTAFLSNQGRNRSFIDFFAREAQINVFLPDDGKHHFDSDLIIHLRRVIDESPSNKIFVILHTYGSHYNYRERYLPEQAVFMPDQKTQPVLENRSQMINAYDNSIICTDMLIDEIINIVDEKECVSAVIYVSDHGEDILDDARERYLHASPVPTYYQMHVPYVFWLSDRFKTQYPSLFDNLNKRQSSDISSSRTLFHTLLSLSGINSPYLDTQKSLAHDDYIPGHRVYLNDLNQGMSLDAVGLRDYDFEQFEAHGISEN